MSTSNGHSKPTYSLATLGIHADDPINQLTDVAPPLHVSTTYRYADNPDDLIPTGNHDLPPEDASLIPESYVYSRVNTPTTSRLELILTSIIGAPCLTYSSGLAAFHALLVWLHPRVIAIGAGYHGSHGVLQVYQKLTACKIVDLFDESTWDAANLGPGDLVHLETPVNPSGRAYDIAAFAALAHARGARLSVDATFGPPPLLDPFAWGADFVMHAGTKYIGGHSDMLCGVLAVRRAPDTPDWNKDYWGLFAERIFLGSVMGGLEGWLGTRSLRTLELRVRRQSENAERLVQFLYQCVNVAADDPANRNIRPDVLAAISQSIVSIEHASLQISDMHWLKKQMPNGFGPVFSLWLKDERMARRLPSKLALFHHATSLGGTESLIEWRRMSDKTVDPRVVRVSVGVEAFEDLREDLAGAFVALAEEEKGGDA